MTWASPLPGWAVAALVTAALALTIWGYARAVPPLGARQRALLTALRVASFLLLLVILLRPVVVGPAPGSGGRDVVVLVDTSRSMQLRDAAGGVSRLNQAVAVVRDGVLPSLERQGFRVDVLGFDERVERKRLDQMRAVGRLSDLAGALRAVGEQSPGRALAGIVVVSDGGETGQAGDVAPVGSAPVFSVAVGSPTPSRDREVVSASVGEATLEQSVIDLSATVVSHGIGREPIEIRVSENGRPVHTRRVVSQVAGVATTEVFRISPPRDRPAVYTVEIPARADEVTADNNRRSVLVRPSGRRRRVLLIEGAPGFEHSFLKRAWARDPGLEIDSVVRKGRNDRGAPTYYVQAAGARAAALTRGYPTTREALFAYDAIVLANVEGDMLSRSQFEDTAAFVTERGGGLLILGARSFAERGLRRTAVGDLLPVDLGGRGPDSATLETRARSGRVEITPAGEVHPITQLDASREASARHWSELPALAAVAPTGEARPGANVLAVARGVGGDRRLLVAVQRYGRGRTMVFAGEASWRWRMMLPSDSNVYVTFWRQAGRWLVAQAPEIVSVSTPPAPPGSSTHAVVHVYDREFRAVGDATVTLRLTGPSGGTRSARAVLEDATSGAYGARLEADRAGVFEVEAEARRGDRVLGVARDWWLAGGSDPEMADPRRNDAVLQRLADATGGAVLDLTETSRLPSLLAERASGSIRLVQRELWHSGWTFLALVACLCAEWTLRRRWGLK